MCQLSHKANVMHQIGKLELKFSLLDPIYKLKKSVFKEHKHD